MTQFNLADELRRGGTGLLAQAVASIWTMRFRDKPYGALNEQEYAQAWLYARQQEAAAVPAGNQAKAPTALDEMRALQEATRSNACERGRCTPELTEMCGKHQDDYEASCVRNNLADGGTTSGYNPGAVAEKNPVIAAIDDYIEGLRAQLSESREALARVEAERDELKRDMAKVIASRGIVAENERVCAVIEAARVYVRKAGESCYDDPPMDKLEELESALSALDQAASEAEVPAMSPQELIERFALCHHDIQMHTCPKCRPVPASEAEVTERAIVVGSVWRNKRYGHIRTVLRTIAASRDVVWDDPSGYQDCWTRESWLEMHEWVSDPEATESATKEAT